MGCMPLTTQALPRTLDGAKTAQAFFGQSHRSSPPGGQEGKHQSPASHPVPVGSLSTSLCWRWKQTERMCHLVAQVGGGSHGAGIGMLGAMA